MGSEQNTWPDPFAAFDPHSTSDTVIVKLWNSINFFPDKHTVELYRLYLLRMYHFQRLGSFGDQKIKDFLRAFAVADDNADIRDIDTALASLSLSLSTDAAATDIESHFEGLKKIQRRQNYISKRQVALPTRTTLCVKARIAAMSGQATQDKSDSSVKLVKQLYDMQHALDNNYSAIPQVTAAETERLFDDTITEGLPKVEDLQAKANTKAEKVAREAEIKRVTKEQMEERQMAELREAAARTKSFSEKQLRDREKSKQRAKKCKKNASMEAIERGRAVRRDNRAKRRQEAIRRKKDVLGSPWYVWSASSAESRESPSVSRSPSRRIGRGLP